MNGLLSFTDRGIYCAAGDFHIDPWRPVDRALITHGHSDHARAGHRAYLSSRGSAPVITQRLGVTPETLAFGERLAIGPVTVSFHPAGHVPGSAQIRVEHKGEVWVVSGDYKVEQDGLSEAFEPVACHTFISECTFGLPVFKWRSQAELMAEINGWWRANAAEGRPSMIGAYALGKAQRLMAGLDLSIGPLVAHGAVEAVNQVLRAQGYRVPDVRRIEDVVAAGDIGRAMVIAPPASIGSAWARKLGPVAEAVASGWMAVRGIRRRRGAERGFVMSDHADWTGLNAAIDATGASRVYVTHGYTVPFRRWLAERGLEAGIVETEFAGEGYEEAAVASGEEGA